MGTNRRKSKYIDLTGMRFGHWTVIERAKKRPYGGTYWVCQCDCGNTSEVDGKHLKNGRSTNCGCSNRWKKFQGAQGSEPRLTHTWNNMMQRCYNTNAPNYNNYGGRGIAVCEQWHDFREFVKWAYQTGYDKNAPYGLFTIERVDVNKGYSPDNCRWVTSKEQSLNKRTSVFITVDGIKRNASEWAKVIEVHRSTVSYWVRKHGEEEAIERIKALLERQVA